ncbi:structural maintenance of chromosome 1, partial [Pancytospora epiphaga]
DTENISNVGGMAEDGLKELYKELNEINKKIDECIPSVTVDDGTVKSKYTMFNKEYAEAKEYAVGLKQEFYEVKQKRMNAFNECFKVITQEVPGIYKMLCGGGGEGNAYIVYEGDPFVNNLKYYLMPPSKRFTEFKELSGGEKSLALLSFIFALNRFKKASFYIFDEVDSALDKANVERLVSFMREVSEQFIVITLKQQVFQHSDALVGIYRCPREDRSKILTYRLKGIE